MTVLATIDAFRADGNSLNTLAWSIERVEGLDGIPALRDKPLEVAHRHGALEDYSQRFYRPKTLAFAMWVAGNDADGNVTAADGPRGHLRTNLQDLTEIMANPSGVTIARDVFYDTLVTRTIKAKLAGRPIPIGGTTLLRRVVFRMRADWPFWESAVQNVNRTGAGNLTPTIDGNAPMAHAIITFESGTDQRLTNGVGGTEYLEYVGAAPGSGGVAIDTRYRTVTQVSNGADLRANLVTTSARWWENPAGSSPTWVLSGTTPGSVDVDFYDQWH